MSWQKRLRDFVHAGGTLAGNVVILTACGPGPDNCFTDPCRRDCAQTPAVAAECMQELQCDQRGGAWSDPHINYARGIHDASPPYCIQFDAGVGDAPHD